MLTRGKDSSRHKCLICLVCNRFLIAGLSILEQWAIDALETDGFRHFTVFGKLEILKPKTISNSW
jgi:hypothetical protein